ERIRKALDASEVEEADGPVLAEQIIARMRITVVDPVAGKSRTDEANEGQGRLVPRLLTAAFLEDFEGHAGGHLHGQNPGRGELIDDGGHADDGIVAKDLGELPLVLGFQAVVGLLEETLPEFLHE